MEKKQNLSDYDPLNLPDVSGKKIVVVTAEWNFEITSSMQKACIKTLTEHGIAPDDIINIYAAGSFELPFAAKESLLKHRADAAVCIGCIIQGETRHFDFIAQATANGIMQVGLECRKPVIFGVLTTDTMQQAVDRSGGKHGNKGTEAAIACLKLLALSS
ncbi:MAG: 6,7-dimethyl-8-ribityllumazine synthase [Bacteroidales bacterium]|jgi:6,7-dimethyl-8-ribityllumazine synthase|nr:6,7-dimethyl-8-ribityllumazine synthase [Bacteroidales bacterium]